MLQLGCVTVSMGKVSGKIAWRKEKSSGHGKSWVRIR
jgi:hypothetical protein